MRDEDFEDIEEPAELGDAFTLADVWAILRMQKWVVVGSVVAALVVTTVWTSMATRYYRSQATVHITTQRALEMEMGEQIDGGMNVWSRPTYLKTRIAIMNSRMVKERILQRYEDLGLNDGIGLNNRGFAILSSSVKMVPRAGTELLDIQVTTPDPELSARLANLVAAVMREDSLTSSRESAKEANEWINGEMGELAQRMDKSGRELREFQRVYDMADVESSQTMLTSRLSNLKSAYGSANTERVQQETRVRNFEEMLAAGDFMGLSRAVEDDLVASLVQRWSEARVAFFDIKTVFLPKMPQYQAAEQRVQEVERSLQQEIRQMLVSERAKLNILRDREADLRAAIDEANLELIEVHGLRDEYDRRKLDLENLKATYAAMTERLTELDLQSKTQLNNVRIVQEARPSSRPATPNVMSNMGLGLIGGLLLGLGGAFAREWLDDTISSPLDVSTYLRVRLLGIVPRVKDETDERRRSLYTHYEPKSGVAEAIRGLRTTLELNPTGESMKRLMVTSALTSEGKTSTTLRLAIAYANLDRKVLVIDADMRRPRIHKVFGGERSPGLATCILGDADFAQTFRPTGIPNLSYLAAGKAFDRPNELLSSPQFEELLKQADEHFDLVLIDTPPSVILSDARLISRHTDAALLVVRERATSRVVVREAILGLQQAGAKLLGAVVNGVDLDRRSSYTYYGYSYRYGYGYAYGSEAYEDDDPTDSRPA